MGIRLEVENKTGIKSEAAKDVKLPFKEIEEVTGIPGFKFSDIDAVHVGEHAIAIIEHTMTAHIANWSEAEWKSKCFKYFNIQVLNKIKRQIEVPLYLSVLNYLNTPLNK